MSQEEMKSLLAEAWKEVFKVDEVSDEADFFEAGGDSIMAVQISAWLIQKGVKLDLSDVFMTPTLGALAEKLTETEPVYVPEAMLTKEIAAREMGFSSVEEAEAAERQNMGFMGNQQVCTPMGNQQVCTPMGNQQVCTPMYGQQVCTPMYGQQICTPMGGQQICMPMGYQQVCTPVYGQQVCAPMGYQQVCTPVCSQQVCTPVYSQQVCTPMGGQQVCTPMPAQQMMTPPAAPPTASPIAPGMAPGMVPPQIQKYLSHGVDTPIENPNVIKIEKAKPGKKEKKPDVALMDVMKGILPDFKKDEDFFEQGLTSLDTVKMVTRCAEAGYTVELKDIYMHSNFNELVECMK
ncbi:MAG: acyl carrier protein [Lachnospiraceae bacterium]|nr:acyl carrier protein [Lachnospiraceae bacterium]